METRVEQQNCGIYKIENLINGKVYIGQSVQLKKRWGVHKAKAKENKRHDDNHLYSAMKKYGIENFKYDVIEYCSVEELNDREIYWISYYDSTNRNKGYNILLGGKSGGNLYNYKEIYEKWVEGKSCKELQDLYKCADSVITNALRYYGIDEDQTRSRVTQKNKYVALSEDKISLRVFNIREIMSFFQLNKSQIDSFYSSLYAGYRFLGYYWEILNENNIPIKELTDEEFLSYRMIQTKVYTDREKLEMSLTKRTVTRPSRKELKQLIRTKPFTEIGKMYGVSDNSIRKWCDFEKLPRKKKDINSYSDEEWEQI